MKKTLFTLLVIIGMLSIPMCCMAEDDFGLEIISGKYYGEEYGFDKFDLVVKNNTDININNIGVTADILDSNENILGQAYLGGTSNVKPGQSITMEAYADHYEGAVKAIANYGYYNDSNNNYYDGYFHDSLEVVFDTSVEPVADNEGENNKSDSEDIDTLKKRIEELESENEALKNHSSENTNIDLESMSVDELKELKASIDNYLEVDTQNDENTDTEDDSNSSEYYDVAKAYWADCENLSDINNYKVIWVKKYSQSVFNNEIFICRTILDENGENDGIKVTIYDTKMGNRKTISEAKFLKDKAKENEIAEEIDWAKVVEFSLQEGDDIEPIPEDSQISYEEASEGKDSADKADTTVEPDESEIKEEQSTSRDKSNGDSKNAKDIDLEDMSIKEIKALDVAIDTILNGDSVEDEYSYLNEMSVKQIKELKSDIDELLDDNTEEKKVTETEVIETEEIAEKRAWKINYYVDEFKEPTDEGFVTNDPPLEGTFSNSATTNSFLGAFFLIEEDFVSLKLFEYGDNLVTNPYSKLAYYNVSVLDQNKNKKTFYGAISPNGSLLCIYDNDDFSSCKQFIDLLKKDGSIKISISDSYNSSYLFTVDCNGFKESYSELCGK